MEKETKGARTKRHLYNCAIDLFRKKGYDHVSVDEIVKMAGMAKGTFYIYFHSKADIILEMLRQYDDYYDHVMASMNEGMPVERRLEEIVKASCRFTQDVIGLDLIRVLYTKQLEAGTEHKRLLNEDRALFSIIADLIREGQADGVYCPEYNPEDITMLILRGAAAAEKWIWPENVYGHWKYRHRDSASDRRFLRKSSEGRTLFFIFMQKN